MNNRQIVLITGGTSGIGKACVKTFLENNYFVILTSHKEVSELSELKEELEHISKEFVIKQLDISHISSITKLKEDIEKEYGKINILINSAGAYTKNSFFDTTEEIWDHIIDVDLKGTFFMTRIFADLIPKISESSIIFISSIAGCYPRKTHIEYAVAKAGVIHMSKSLAQVLAPIRINCVSPSYTVTDFMPEMKDPEWVKEKKALIPLGDFNTTEDVAHTVFFLTSPEARMITGENIIIDGGRGAQM